MRSNKWKIYILIAISFAIGAVAGLIVAVLVPEKYDLYRGLFAFGTVALVSSVLTFIGVRILRIGEE